MPTLTWKGTRGAMCFKGTVGEAALPNFSTVGDGHEESGDSGTSAFPIRRLGTRFR